MPGMVVFIFVADLIHMSESTIGPAFVFSFLFVSLLQVSWTGITKYTTESQTKPNVLTLDMFLALHCARHNSCNVAVENRSWQFGYSILDVAWWPPGLLSAGDSVPVSTSRRPSVWRRNWSGNRTWLGSPPIVLGQTSQTNVFRPKRFNWNSFYQLS